MAYLYLLCAIVMEVAGTICLKLSNEFENPAPSGLAFLFYGLMNVPLETRADDQIKDWFVMGAV